MNNHVYQYVERGIVVHHGRDDEIEPARPYWANLGGRRVIRHRTFDGLQVAIRTWAAVMADRAERELAQEDALEQADRRSAGHPG